MEWSWLRHLAPRSQIGTSIGAFGLLLLVGTADLLGGIDFSFDLFYVLPVVLATWYGRRRPAVGIVLACGVVWFLEDLLTFTEHGHPLVPYWNVAVLTGFLFIVLFAVGALKESQQREMELAGGIQRGLVPKNLPSWRSCDLAVHWQPMKGVGGDYYDVFAFSDQQLGLCIGDGVGHGVPAALLMSNLQAAVHVLARASREPQELCTRINRLLCENLDLGHFITFFYGRIDDSGGRLVYTNAGHNSPLLVRVDGSLTRLDQRGMVLGVDRSTRYSQATVDLHAGDRLVLFTDGVTEARNLAGTEFGDERLIDLVSKHRQLAAEPLKEQIVAGLSRFRGRRSFDDDVTLLVLSFPTAPA